MNIEIKGDWINDVLRTVLKIEPVNTNVQLSILTRALARGAKMCGVPVETIVANLTAAYEAEQISLVIKQ